MLEIRHLKTLHALRESDSLVEAAERLHLTQSALSHQFKELEERMGMPLFVRKTKPVRFTSGGLRLLQLADAMLPLLRGAERDIARLVGGTAGRLHMAIECHSCFQWLMPTIDQFRDAWPEVELDLASGFAFAPLPALARGEVVISDRFTDATFAYQGGGRGVAFDKITQLERWVQGDLQPDFTLLFDVPLDVARARLTQRAAQTQEALDKFEQESFGFFKRTREAYLQRAEQSPQRMAVIDSTRSLNEVKAQIRAAIVARPQLQLTIE